jgi:uncharacterized membrane protein
VLKSDTADRSGSTARVLDLSGQDLLTVTDAAGVACAAGAKKPATPQLHNLADTSTLDGAFEGLLFGPIFLISLVGLAAGAAIFARIADVGIDDRFIQQVWSQVTECTSHLILMARDAVLDRAVDAIRQEGLDSDMLGFNLSQGREQRLRAVFAERTA